MRAHAQQEGTIQIRQARRTPAGRRTIWRLHAGAANEDGSAIRRAHGVGLPHRPRAADRHRLTPQQEHAAILAPSRIGTFFPRWHQKMSCRLASRLERAGKSSSGFWTPAAASNGVVSHLLGDTTLAYVLKRTTRRNDLDHACRGLSR